MRPITEVLWLHEWFRKTRKSAPTRQWRWAPVSASWDSQEVVDSFRDEATTDSADIWRAVCEHEVSGRWPKLSGRAAHFLRERLDEGLALCSALLREHGPLDSAARATRPQDSQALVRRVLIDHWDTKGAEAWVADHKHEFQEPAPDETDPYE
jgi:hypothetical protein